MNWKSFILLILIIGLSWFNLFTIKSFSEKYSDEVISIVVDDEHVIAYDEIRSKSVYEKNQVALASQRQGTIEKKEKEKVALVATNSFFSNLEDFHFIEGSYFSETALASGSNVTVISEKTAMDMFGSYHAVGNQMMINEYYYLVVGVYRNEDIGFKAWIADGKEKVYIPLTSSIAYNWKIKNIYVHKEKNVNNDYLLSILEIDKLDDQVYEYKDSYKILRSWAIFPWLILIIYLCKKGIYYTKQKNKVAIVWWGILIIAFAIIKHYFYVSPEALPSNNFFDLSFYIEYFKQQHRQFNAIRESQLSGYISLYQSVRNTIIILDFIHIFMLIKLEQQINCKLIFNRFHRGNHEQPPRFENISLCRNSS